MVPNGYVPIEFPACRYHATEKPRIVRSQAEADALGPGWFDTPAKCIDTVAGQPKPPVEHELSLWKADWRKVVSEMRKLTSLERLSEIAAIEERNPKVKGGRDQVLNVIRARAKEITKAQAEAAQAEAEAADAAAKAQAESEPEVAAPEEAPGQ